MSEYYVETQNMVEMDVTVDGVNLEMDASSNQNVPMTTDQTTRVIEAISPTAEVTRVEGGAKITITDKNGTTEATINDGQDGTNGEKGDQGDPGPMPDFSVGNVSTGEPGSDASVVLTGTQAEPILNFTIPKGDKGDDGVTPSFSIGTVQKGDDAAATITGTDENPVLNLTLPKGDKGDTGSAGPAGAGVIAGGTTGQYMKKKSNADYDTEWGDVPDPTGKADKVANATAGNFAGLDSSGNLTDSGSKASDFLTSHQDISGKADKVTGATNGHLAGLDSNGNLTDSGKSEGSFVSSNQGSANAGKALGIANDGSVTPVPFSGEDFTGATASTAGTHGYVPAPAAGQNIAYYLCGDGTWSIPPGAKLVVFDLDTVTNTSGSYTHTTTISDASADMKVVLIELSNPAAFLDTISVTTADGSITLSCNSVEGTSTVKASAMFVSGSNVLTSSEFDVLAGRIGALGDLETTTKTNIVAAINEVNSNLQRKAITFTAVSPVQTNYYVSKFDASVITNVMIIEYTIQADSSSTSAITIGTLSEFNRSTLGQFIADVPSHSSTSSGNLSIIITSDGTVKCAFGANTKVYYGSLAIPLG